MKKLITIALIYFISTTSFAFSNNFKLITEPIQRENYIKFGNWPQSIKNNDVTITEDITYNINGFTCYKGSDNYYYIKIEANPFNKNTKDIKFSNGTQVIQGDKYYFKIEPIKWDILKLNDKDEALVLSNKILFNHYYSKDDARWDKSDLRKYINGSGFLDKAFTKEAKSFIKTTKLDNSSSINAKDTKDKIFLLSLEDITNKELGFVDSIDETTTRERYLTDYAIATGSLTWGNSSANQNGWYFLRTNNKNDFGSYINAIYTNGCISHLYKCEYENNIYGIVPAMVLSL